MPKKAITSNVVKRSVGNKKASKKLNELKIAKKAPVTKERELTKSLIETLKKEAKSKGVTLKSLLTEKEIKILTERAHKKAFETAGKRVVVTADYARDLFSNLDSPHSLTWEGIKISTNKKYAMFEIGGRSQKLILPKEEVLKLLFDKRTFKRLEIYSWDFGELVKDVKYNSSPKAKEYFDTLIKEKIDKLTEYKQIYDGSGYKSKVPKFRVDDWMESHINFDKKMIRHLSKAGVPIEKLEPYISKNHVIDKYIVNYSQMLVENYGFNEYISKIIVPNKGNKNFNSDLKDVLLRIKDPKTAIKVAGKVLTLTEKSEVWETTTGEHVEHSLNHLPKFCKVLGKGGFFTSKQHEKAAARFLFDDINFLKVKYIDDGTRDGKHDFIASDKEMKYKTLKSMYGSDYYMDDNISQYWKYGLRPLLKKGTLSRKRLLELLDVRFGLGESETKTMWLNHLIFFEAITPEQVNLYQNMKRK